MDWFVHFAALESNCEILNFVEIGPPSSWSGFASGSFCFLFSTNPSSRKWIETRQLAWSRTKITNVSTYLSYNRASKPWKAGFATGGRELKFTSNWSAVQSVQLYLPSNRNGWSYVSEVKEQIKYDGKDVLFIGKVNVFFIHI